MNSNFNLEGLFQQAYALHNAGNFAEASKLYQKLYQAIPNNETVNFLYGTLFIQMRDYSNARYHLNQALDANPLGIKILNSLGILCQSEKNHTKAIEYFNKILALENENLDALNNLAISLREAGNFSDSIKYLEIIISKEGVSDENLYNLGLAYQNAENFEKAEDYYNQVLAINPYHFLCYNNLGLIFQKRGDVAKGMEYFLKAFSINENCSEACFNIAVNYKDTEKYESALQFYNKVLSIDPFNFDALLGKSALFYNLRMFLESEYYCKTAIPIDSANSEAYYNLGLTYHEMGKFDKALENIEKAILLDPKNTPAIFARSDIFLIQEKYHQAWDDYEIRLEFTIYKDRKYSKPMYTGERLLDKTLYIFEEQGAGDTFMLIRYLKYIKIRGAKIILECRPETARLFKHQIFIDRIVVMGEQKISEVDFDYFLPLMSLGKVLQIGAIKLDAIVPYIGVPDNMIAEKSEILAKYSKESCIKAGIVWTGNQHPPVNRKRHVPVSFFKNLATYDGIQLFSLQVGDSRSELALNNLSGCITDLSPFIKDFADTAAFIEALDIVITIDTSLAHLAGALDAETYVILPRVADWRWGQEGHESKWYPSQHLFRQTTDDSWVSVFDELETLLEKKFNLSKARREIVPENVEKRIILALTGGNNFGWGVCSDYLKKEMSAIRPVIVYDEESLSGDVIRPLKAAKEHSVVLHALAGVDLDSFTRIRGTENYGYTFFEGELNPNSIENSKNYIKVIAGSSWCVSKLNEKGISNTDLLIQGIDPGIFYPIDEKSERNNFVIFSGGKFEIRKGQDLVLAAFKIIQEKYPDIILVNSWYNLWTQSMELMSVSKHINFEMRGETHNDIMSNLYAINGIDLNRVITLPLMPNEQLRKVYASTDIALFPNRCEGGTNLVLMEYMACAKPVIATYTSGHKDILTEDNSLMLKNLHPYRLYDGKTILSSWEEATIDEIVSSIEFAYCNRAKINQLGKNAGEDLKKLTWRKTAEKALEILTKG